MRDKNQGCAAYGHTNLLIIGSAIDEGDHLSVELLHSKSTVRIQAKLADPLVFGDQCLT